MTPEQLKQMLALIPAQVNFKDATPEQLEQMLALIPYLRPHSLDSVIRWVYGICPLAWFGEWRFRDDNNEIMRPWKEDK